MIGKIIGSGRGIAGMVDYGLHDQTSRKNPHPTTSERVAWTACLGLPIDDPQLMVRAMQGLTADAPALKAAAGISARGRKLKKPYTHLVFNWPPGAKPSKAEMLSAVAGGLKSIGLDERHYAVCTAHNDTDHPHVHVFVSRIDPETGKAVNLDKGATDRLSRWAEQYEREHGGIVVPGRVAAREARQARIGATRELRKAGVDRDEARSTAADLHPQPPRARRATKSQPQPTPLTPDQRAEWTRLHDRQREELRRQRAADNERIARRRREWREWKAARTQARSTGASAPVPPRPRSPSVRQLRADGARERAQLQRRHRAERVSLARRLRRVAVRAFAAVRTWLQKPPAAAPDTTDTAAARQAERRAEAEKRLAEAQQQRLAAHRQRLVETERRAADRANTADLRHDRAKRDAEMDDWERELIHGRRESIDEWRARMADVAELQRQAWRAQTAQQTAALRLQRFKSRYEREPEPEPTRDLSAPPPPVRRPLREPRPPAAAGAAHPAGAAGRRQKAKAPSRPPARPPRRRAEPPPRPRLDPGSRPVAAEPPSPPSPAGSTPTPSQAPGHQHYR